MKIGNKSDQDVIDNEYEVSRSPQQSKPKRYHSAFKAGSKQSCGFLDSEAAKNNSPFEVVARARRESRSKDRIKATANLGTSAK